MILLLPWHAFAVAPLATLLLPFFWPRLCTCHPCNDLLLLLLMVTCLHACHLCNDFVAAILLTAPLRLPSLQQFCCCHSLGGTFALAILDNFAAAFSLAALLCLRSL
jgi:hypothetical protein